MNAATPRRVKAVTAVTALQTAGARDDRWRRLFPEHDLPTHDRVPHLRAEQFRLWHREQVAVHDGQVGELARLDRTAGLFLERCECGIRGEAAYGLGEGQSLGGAPAALRPLLLVLTRHGGVDAEERVHVLHREIGA